MTGKRIIGFAMLIFALHAFGLHYLLRPDSVPNLHATVTNAVASLVANDVHSIGELARLLWHYICIAALAVAKLALCVGWVYAMWRLVRRPTGWPRMIPTLLVSLAHIFSLPFVMGARCDATVPAIARTVSLFWSNLFTQEIAPRLSDIGHFTLVGGGATIATVAVIALLIAVFILLLRRAEIADQPDNLLPKFEHVRELITKEDAPGYAQNHFVSVTPLKKGFFRRLVLSFAFWGIKQTVTYWFRPGLILNMGTIHYAKWVRIPGTDNMIFQSNFDGSWQNYLEDFITRAHEGQSAAWSNAIGFPKTRFLIQDGASDSDRFKNFVRDKQIVSRFWYSRFPELTTSHIRSNALIHDGLAHARDETDARRWLDVLGCAPRQDYELETNEIQSLVFRGLKNAKFMSCMLITLPDDPIKRGKWIRTLIDSSHIEELIVDPKAEWINTIEAYVPVKFGAFPARMQLQGMADIDSLEDDPFKPVDLAAYFALSATGLAKFGTEKRSNGDLLGNLPYPFRLGMAQRSRTLGDFGEAAPENWRWSDADDQGKPTVDGVLMVYHEDEVLCSTALKIHKRLLEDAGGAIVHTIPTQPTPKSTLRPHEHFGFRDGISQPIIRGTEQFSRRAASRDIVAPGEFILGYKNNQGYVAPAITVPDESDIADKLPAENAAQSLRMPDFGDRSLSSSRDFGRNGSFLVIRQLMQDVEGFQSFTEQKVSELWDYDRLPEKRWGKLQNIIGQPITEEWVAAKLMGRWRDGRPLVGNPTQIDDTRGDNDGNDFAYGIDDPRGLQCPLGAHIRRTNPRDSLEPGDAEEQDITNRHRILRRGRSYQYDPDTQAYQPFDANRLKNPERGLMFMALCADIERQFEFVQQTWMGSPNFHGLSNEPDPVMSYVPDEAESKRKRVFTIPTTSGPVTLHNIGVKQGDEGGLSSFVLPKGGGYFFLPSRAALLYLAALET